MSGKIKGITIEIGGDTKGLDKAIKSVNGEIRSTSNELKQVEKLLKLDPGNTELLAQKQLLLGKNIETVENKLRALKQAKEKADADMANGTEVNQEQYRKLQREVVATENDLKDLGKAADNAGKELEDAADNSEGFTITKGVISDLVANGIEMLISKTGELVEQTREYREDMNKLNTAYEKANFNTETAKKVYSDFFVVLGESDRSVEAVNHLAKFVDVEEDLVKWGNIAAGVNAEFTDSLPVEGLTEAANESAKTAKVTGVLADALNWAGISEDEFNAKLAACNSEKERSALITNTLNNAYADSAARYKEMNADIIANREATLKLNEAEAELGAVLEPILTKAKLGFAEVLTFVADNKQAILTAVAAVSAAFLAFKGTAVITGTITAITNLVQGLKTAETATQALNVAMSSNAISLAISAVAGLVAALVTYSSSAEEASTAGGRVYDSLKEIEQSHKEAIKAIDDAVAAEVAEAQSALLLKDKLYSLEEQIKSGTLTNTEAELAQKEFNTAADELSEIIPEITECLYDETGGINIQKSAVEGLTTSYYELAMAKAMAGAYEDKMKETAEKLVAAKETQKEALAEYNRILDETPTQAKTKNSNNPRVREAAASAEKGYESVRRNAGQISGLDDANELVASLEKEFENYFTEMSAYTDKVDEISDGIVETAKDTENAITKTVTDGNSERLKETNSSLLKEAKFLKKSLDVGLISYDKYYYELAKLRNEYFEEGSEEWEEYSDDILEYYTDILSDAKAEAYTQVQEVQQMQEGLFQKLQEGTKTYRQISITEKGKETTYTKLADVGIDNRSLEQYNNLIDRLFEKQRDLPKDFMENLSGMSVDEGISFLTALLSASDEELNNYMLQLERNEKLAAEISGKIASVEMEETAQEIVNQFSQVSEDFFAIGEESAKVYGEGFMNELDNVYNQVREQVLSILPDLELASNVTGAAVSGMSNAGNTSNKYDNSRHTSVTINNHSPSGISPFAERLGLEKLMDKLSMQGVL